MANQHVIRAAIEPLEPRCLFSGTATATPQELIAQANNQFAFDLLHQLPSDSSGNSFFSPYSAATALEMALQGANGATASEMIAALHLPSATLTQAGIAALNQLFQANAASDGFTLSTANRLWFNQNYPLLQSFITDSQNTFGASPQSVDFSNPAQAAQTINDWVSQQTHGKITNLIKPGDLNTLTELVITNAIYFQADWASTFDPNSTGSAPFQITLTQAATVSMMRQIGFFSYYAQTGTNGFQALDLPYKGNDTDMVVILPNTYDLSGFSSTLTADTFSKITSNFSQQEVSLDLPKFTFGELYDLVPPLENLGMQTAFTRSADFSGIVNKPLQITDVVQKSFVQVDEEGTTAAAATGVIVGVSAMPVADQTFDVNHPFIFAIRQRSTNTILFLGSVADPSTGSADYATSGGAELPARR